MNRRIDLGDLKVIFHVKYKKKSLHFLRCDQKCGNIENDKYKQNYQDMYNRMYHIHLQSQYLLAMRAAIRDKYKRLDH